MKQFVFISLFLIALPILAIAQQPYLNTTYDPNPYGQGAGLGAIMHFDDSTYYISGTYTGSANPSIPGGIFLYKINYQGKVLDTLLFENYLNTNGVYKQHYVPINLVRTQDSGFVITYTISDTSGWAETTLVKFNKNGFIVWNKAFKGTFIETNLNQHLMIWGIIETSDNGFVLTGATRGLNSTNIQCVILKTDSLGNKEWLDILGIDAGYLHETGVNILELPDQQILLGYGESSSTNDLYGNTKLVKYSPTGTKIWTKSYGGSFAEGNVKLNQCSEGNLLLSYAKGYYHDYYTSYQIEILKLDSNGNIMQTKNYGPYYPSRYGSYNIWGAKLNSKDELYISGNTSDHLASNMQAFLLKTDSNGDSIYMRYYNKLDSVPYNADFSVWDMVLEPEGGVSFVGQVMEMTIGGFAGGYIIRTDSFGCMYQGCHTIGIEDPLDKYSNILIYPNPAHSEVTIELSESLRQATEIRIYNSVGQLIISQNINSNTFNHTFSVEHLSSGLYIFQIHNKHTIIASGKFLKE